LRIRNLSTKLFTSAAVAREPLASARRPPNVQVSGRARAFGERAACLHRARDVRQASPSQAAREPLASARPDSIERATFPQHPQVRPRASLWRARGLTPSSRARAFGERATEQHRSYYGATSTLPPPHHIKFATVILYGGNRSRQAYSTPK
jgi:hypothetical protein